VRAESADYLEPYEQAARRHRGGFESLLWASPRSQRARFEAIVRACDLNGQSVLDAGCGRADLMAYLLERKIRPADYIGLEAVNALADEAETQKHPDARILRGDFVVEPGKLFVGADVIVFSGSLNTLDDAAFYETLNRAIDATAHAVVFNFLNSTALAGKDYLHWRRTDHVVSHLRSRSNDIHTFSDYLPGDCTIAVFKPAE
jgi:hypothetical protein